MPIGVYVRKPPFHHPLIGHADLPLTAETVSSPSLHRSKEAVGFDEKRYPEREVELVLQGQLERTSSPAPEVQCLRMSG